MVVQIFTQVLVQSRPSDIGNEVFRVFDHSLFLFMWHIKGTACVSSKLSQDFQNWMEKCTILKIIYFWRCNFNVWVFSSLSPLKLWDRIQYLAPAVHRKSQIKLHSPTYWILEKETYCKKELWTVNNCLDTSSWWWWSSSSSSSSTC